MQYVQVDSSTNNTTKEDTTIEEGCIYCKSTSCVAYTQGESICGYDYSLDE